MKKRMIAFFILLTMLLSSYSVNALIMNVPGGNNNNTTQANRQTKPITTEVQQTKIITQKQPETTKKVTTKKVEELTTTQSVFTETHIETSNEQIKTTANSQVYAEAPVDVSNVMLTVTLNGETDKISSYVVVVFQNKNTNEEFSLNITQEACTASTTLPLGSYSVSIVDSENKQLEYDIKNIDLTSAQNSLLTINISNVKNEDNFIIKIFKNNIFAISGIIISIIVFIIFKKRQDKTY